MLMQTIGPEMDPGLRAIIMADIMELKRMPDLAKRVRDYRPQPDPIQQEMAKLQIELLKSQIELNKAKALTAQADAENTALQTEQDATGVDHQREMALMGAQAEGNRARDVTLGLLNGETPVQNIQAAVGYNSLVEKKNEMRATQPPRVAQPYVPPAGQVPLAPLQSAQQMNPAQRLAYPR